MTLVHLDTDIGGDPDDVAALALLLRWPAAEIIGITTVTENNGKRAGYAKYVLQTEGREDIPVKAGADVSGGYYRYHPEFPVERDYWPEPVSPSPNPLSDALELLKASIERGAIIIGIGQYTNFALLDRKYPGILREANLFLMGGYIHPVREGFPAWGSDDDYNVQLDVNSAEYVLRNSSPTLIPLSVTVETALRRAHLSSLRRAGKLGELIAVQAEALDAVFSNEENIGKEYPGLPHDILNFQHDPLACAVALGWDGVGIEELLLKIEVRDGSLYETIDDSGATFSVVTRVDGRRFNEFWLATVKGDVTH